MEGPIVAPVALAIMFSLGMAYLLFMVVLVRWLSRLGRRPPGAPPPAQGATSADSVLVPPRAPPSGADLPYTRQPHLLTAAEREFFQVLRAAAPDGWHVFPQVRLANLVQVPSRTRGWKYHFGRVAQKCVDFVLCEPAALAPRLVVELDDASHNRPSRQERDAFVDSVLQRVGLPILHVRWQRSYNPAQLAAQIRAVVDASDPWAAPLPQAVAPAVRWACHACGAEVESSAKFCTACGRRLEL